MLFLLNPGGKKKRKYRKARRKGCKGRKGTAAIIRQWACRRGASRRLSRLQVSCFAAKLKKVRRKAAASARRAAKRQRRSYYADWRAAKREAPKRAKASVMRSFADWAATGKNPSRRRRRHRFSYRPKSRNYSSWIPDYLAPNPYWIPQYAYNPGATITSRITEGYKPKTLINALPFAGGFVGNIALSSFVSRWLPGMLQSGLPRIAVNVATAGLLGAGVGMISPRFSSGVFWGGVTQALVGGLTGLGGRLFGLGDFATVADAANARSLGGLGQLYDLGADVISSELTQVDPLEDLRGATGVTPEDYGARRIGYNVNDLSTSWPSTPERLQAANNAAVEGTATEELMVEM